jgi:hypothetical protein
MIVNWNGYKKMFISPTFCVTYTRFSEGILLEVISLSELEPVEYETGTPIRDYDIIEITQTEIGYHVLLDINLDSGYSLSQTTLEITNEDLVGYETNDVEEGIKYALGFFNH